MNMSTMLRESNHAVLNQLHLAGHLRVGVKMAVGTHQGKIVATIRDQIVGAVPALYHAKVAKHLQDGGYLTVAAVHATDDGSRFLFFQLNAR